jgi:predicted XRE-type DNA-binding protein
MPREVRRDVGYALYVALQGDAKPLTGFGAAAVIEVIARHHDDRSRAQATQARRAGLQAMDRDRRKTMSRKKATVTPGSGNVFADLGLPDAATELVKAQLTYHIAKNIKALGLTQTQAAQRFGVSQPDISRLMKTRPTGFSTDRLLAMLTALDLDVDIVLRPASPSPHAAKVRIIEQRS